MSMEVQNVYDYCTKCKSMNKLLEKRRLGIELTKNEVENMRYKCRYCRSFGSTGIYKADAILTALEERKRNENNLTPGRKPVREKQYGRAVRKLREEGKSIREIADILGISKATVQKILK